MNKGLGAPQLFTKRLYIRLIDFNDLEAFFNICRQPKVTQYLTFEPHQYLSDTYRVIENMLRSYYIGQSVNFAIFLQSNHCLIGSASLTFNNLNHSAEIGYLLDSFYWNQGYMTEAIQSLIEIAFEYYQVDFLYAKHILENVASQKIIEKMHFQKIGIHEKAFYKNHHAYTIVEYQLTKKEYFLNKK